jgi:hypothetical protein
MDCAMDLIGLIWLKLDTLLLIEVVSIFSKTQAVSGISILNSINVSIRIGYIVYDMVGNDG